MKEIEAASLLEAVFEVLGLANILSFILAIFGIQHGKQEGGWG